MTPTILTLISIGAPMVMSVFKDISAHFAQKAANAHQQEMAKIAASAPAALQAGVTALLTNPTKAGAQAAGLTAAAQLAAGVAAAPTPAPLLGPAH